MTPRPAARPPARPGGRAVVPRLRPLTPAHKQRIHASLDALLAPLRSAARTVARAARTAAGYAHAVGSVTAYALSTAPRPAWASPYGPTPRPTGS